MTRLLSAALTLFVALGPLCHGPAADVPRPDGRADPLFDPAAEQQALAVVERCHGTFRRADDTPGAPVVAVAFQHTEVEDADLADLAKLTCLQSLRLHHCGRFTAAGLEELARLPRLRDLDLSRCEQVGADLLKPLARCRPLRSLDLSGCAGVTDAELRELARLDQLQALTLGRCERVTGEG